MTISFFVFCLVIAIPPVFTSTADNKTIEQMIQEAGCPYVGSNQLLRKGICLMPDYDSNEPPLTIDEKTNVDFAFLHDPQVMQIDERKNSCAENEYNRQKL